MNFSLNNVAFKVFTPTKNASVTSNNLTSTDSIIKDSGNVSLSGSHKINFDFSSWINKEPQAGFSAEKQGQITALFSKLTEEQQFSLVESGIAVNDEFLSVASKLDDDELSKLADVVGAMKIAASSNYTWNNELDSKNSRSSEEKLMQFMDALSKSSSDGRSNILERAHQYSKNVNRHEDRNVFKDTYDAIDGMFKNTSTANDVQNFVTSVIDSDDAEKFVDKLSQFDSDQQSNLLNVLGFEQELGFRLLDSMLDKSVDVKDEMLDFLGGLAGNANVFNDFSTFSHEKNVGIKSGSRDNAFDTVTDMIDNTVSLLEKYNFSDEQLLDMSNDLSGLNRHHQIAYLEISSVGLETLLSEELTKNPKLPLDMTNHDTEMNALEGLRQDKEVRDAVYHTREGEQGWWSDGFYTPKTKSQYKEDLNEIMSFLINGTTETDVSNSGTSSINDTLLERFNTLKLEK